MPALLGYAAARLVGVAMLVVAASREHRHALNLLDRRWDSVWYARIAEQGYGYHVPLPGGKVHSSLAFFPMLPALERYVSAVLPLDAADAGLLVGSLASLAAAWGVYAVGARLYGERAGAVLAVLWGVVPTAYVQSMAYTETLFTAWAAWALYAVLTDRWVVAGVLCAGAGLARPSGAALLAALVLTAAWRFVCGERTDRRVLLGALIAPLGWLSYVLFVAVRRGSPLAYFQVQAEWDNRIDGGLAMARFVRDQFAHANLAAGLGLCAAFVLLAWVVRLCVRQRQPLPVLLYCLAIVVISLVGSGYFASRPRLLMPAFPLLMPAAVAMACWRTSRVTVVLALAAIASGGYGAWVLLGTGPP